MKLIRSSNVSLSFHWEGMERQVIIKGISEKISSTESDSYFDTRPIGSKLGAYVSMQSSVINSRKELEDKLNNLSVKFKNKPINRPDFWGGFIVKPVEFEFWQGRSNRLHDRIRYRTNDNINWKTERLSP